MPDDWVATVRRRLASLREEPPQRLIHEDAYDDSQVAAMLRELGIALLEVEQPLWIQVGTEGYELAKSSRLITHLDMAGRGSWSNRIEQMNTQTHFRWC